MVRTALHQINYACRGSSQQPFLSGLVALPRAARRTPRHLRRHLCCAACNATPHQCLRMHILTTLYGKKALNSKVAPGIPAFLIQARRNIWGQLGFVKTNFCRNVTSLCSVLGRILFWYVLRICCIYSKFCPFLMALIALELMVTRKF